MPQQIFGAPSPKLYKNKKKHIGVQGQIFGAPSPNILYKNKKKHIGVLEQKRRDEIKKLKDENKKLKEENIKYEKLKTKHEKFYELVKIIKKEIKELKKETTKLTKEKKELDTFYKEKLENQDIELKEKLKRYRELSVKLMKSRECSKEAEKEFYRNNLIDFKKYDEKKMTCGCGSIIQRRSKRSHMTTAKHKRLMNAKLKEQEQKPNQP